MISESSLTTFTPTSASSCTQGTAWIAVDANQRYIRLVVVVDHRILGAFEARSGPRQVARTIRFIRETLPPDARPILVGRYYDRWDSRLHAALVMEFGPVSWINPNLLHVTLPDVERWHRMFGTYRALLYAICAEEAAKRTLLPILDCFDLLCAWKNAVLDNLNANYTRT